MNILIVIFTCTKSWNLWVQEDSWSSLQLESSIIAARLIFEAKEEDRLTAKVQKGRIPVEKKTTRASDFLVAHIEIIALFRTSACSQNLRCPGPFRRESVPPCTYTSFLFFLPSVFLRDNRVVQFVPRNGSDELTNAEVEKKIRATMIFTYR